MTLKVENMDDGFVQLLCALVSFAWVLLLYIP